MSCPVVALTTASAWVFVPLIRKKSPPSSTFCPSGVTSTARATSSALAVKGSSEAPVVTAAKWLLGCPPTWVKSPAR